MCTNLYNHYLPCTREPKPTYFQVFLKDWLNTFLQEKNAQRPTKINYNLAK